MAKKITALMFCALLVLSGGLSVAYYNTKSFGFDENAKVFSCDEEKFSLMDFEIYYDDISFFIDELSRIVPEKSHAVIIKSHDNVDVI